MGIISKNIKDTIEYTMENTTGTNGDDVGRVDYYIENGIYGWRRTPPKRPVYERTQNILDSTSTLDITIEDGFKKRGW